MKTTKIGSVPVNYLMNDRDVLAALADVEAIKKREYELRHKHRIRRLKDTGLEWARLCSCHGVPHLALARSWATIFLWTIVELAAWSGFFYFTYYCINSYLQYNTVIKVQINDQDQYEFPSVTICNNSPYQATRFMQTPQLHGMLLLYQSLLASSAR